MQSTLMIGDYFVANKFIWGYGKYSFPLAGCPFNGRILGREPDRGDIAVFRTGAAERGLHQARHRPAGRHASR